ncbi:electron transport complex subunit RsxC [candidate division KSB1 bacterium]|nr:electron transport complex subunit RsxC [candidate division KSB1 bacterium]
MWFKSKSFKGGVHPPENKAFSDNKVIEKLPLPERVVIPLAQHIGAPAEPIVSVGDEVKTGQKIGQSKGFVSVPCHASISGIVKKIEPRPHPVGGDVLAIEIEGDGNDIMSQDFDFNPDYMVQSVDEMKENILEAGIAGMGGATFPTHVKLSPPPDKTIDTLILNGAECEPFLTSDARLMIEFPKEIIEGLRILMKILNCKRGYIAIEKNKPNAISLFHKLINDSKQSDINVVGLKVKYPQGAEKQLIKAIVNRNVPAGGLPMDVGCLVQNVGTAKAVYDAISKKLPLIERVVTVTGKGIKEPKNVLARIGTPFQQVIDFCGGLTDDAAKIINGGPMMGIAQFDLEVPVIKGTSGIVILNTKQAILPQPQPCISCARCVDSCPMGLMPNYLATLVENQKFEQAKEFNIKDCIECGSCSYVCPSKIRHVHLFKFGKMHVAKMMKPAA